MCHPIGHYSLRSTEKSSIASWSGLPASDLRENRQFFRVQKSRHHNFSPIPSRLTLNFLREICRDDQFMKKRQDGLRSEKSGNSGRIFRSVFSSSAGAADDECICECCVATSLTKRDHVTTSCGGRRVLAPVHCRRWIALWSRASSTVETRLVLNCRKEARDVSFLGVFYFTWWPVFTATSIGVPQSITKVSRQ